MAGVVQARRCGWTANRCRHYRCPPGPHGKSSADSVTMTRRSAPRDHHRGSGSYANLASALLMSPRPPYLPINGGFASSCASIRKRSHLLSLVGVALYARPFSRRNRSLDFSIGVHLQSAPDIVGVRGAQYPRLPRLDHGGGRGELTPVERRPRECLGAFSVGSAHWVQRRGLGTTAGARGSFAKGPGFVIELGLILDIQIGERWTAEVSGLGRQILEQLFQFTLEDLAVGVARKGLGQKPDPYRHLEGCQPSGHMGPQFVLGG